jgi:hypothetical protein
MKLGTALAAIILASGLPASVAAKDFRASEAEAIDNVIKCNSYRNGWIAKTTGPCADFQRPAKVALGQSFFVGGQAHVIRVIVASQAEKDYSDDVFSIRAGQWYCTAAESTDDLDMDGSKNQRDWLFIPRCYPTQ